MNKDLTQGSVMGSMLRFAVPMILGDLLQQCYNVADTLIVGRFLGPDALAAVGSSFTLMTFLTSILLGLCMGSSAVFSIRFGQKDFDGLKDSIFTSFLLIAAICAVLNLAAFLSIGWILLLLKVPEEIQGLMRDYLMVIFSGITAVFLYNYFSCLLRAVGNSVIPLVFLAVSAVMNIGLDLWFVLGLKRGVAGAAVATIFSQGIAGVLSAVYIFKKYKLLFPVNADERKFHPYYMKNIIKMCMPMGLQYSITAIGAIILQFYVNALGEDAIAGFTSGYKIKNLILCPLNALGTALSSFIGQNFGAKRFDRISEGFKRTLEIGLIYSVITMIVCFFTGRYMALIFVDAADTVVVGYTVKFIRYISVFNAELALLFTARYSVQGMGYGKYSILSGLAEMAGRAAVAVLLIPHFGFDAVCWNEGLTFLAGIAVILPIYIKLFCHLRKSMI